MKAPSVKPVRCAIYTRVSTEHGLDQEFNSLDAQYEAASAYIKSQAHAGWTLIRSRYDDGGYSDGSTDRPNLQKLLDDSPLKSAEPGDSALVRNGSSATPPRGKDGTPVASGPASRTMLLKKTRRGGPGITLLMAGSFSRT